MAIIIVNNWKYYIAVCFINLGNAIIKAFRIDFVYNVLIIGRSL